MTVASNLHRPTSLLIASLDQQSDAHNEKFFVAITQRTARIVDPGRRARVGALRRYPVENPCRRERRTPEQSGQGRARLRRHPEARERHSAMTLNPFDPARQRELRG